MDHPFPSNATRHHNSLHGPSSIISNQNSFRLSPVLNRSNSSSSQAYNTSAIFGSTNPITTLFEDTNFSNNFCDSTPANVFNFPLRSSRAVNTNSNFNTNSGAHLRNSSQVTRNNTPRSTIPATYPGLSSGMNKSRGQNLQKNSSVHDNQTANLQNGESKNSSGVCNDTLPQSCSINSSEATIGNSQMQPQYRIFKRGDSIPGINSPITIINNSRTPNNGNATVGLDNDTSKSTNSVMDKENNSRHGIAYGVDFTEPNLNSKPSQANNCSRTPISLVGDIARFHGLKIEYRLTKEAGPPHAPTFTVILHLGNDEKYEGLGSSIKRAQHAAAAEALEKTALTHPPPKAQPKGRNYGSGYPGSGNQLRRPNSNWPIIQLTSLAEELKEPISFVQQPVPIHDPIRRMDPLSIISVTLGDKVFTGEGPNINAAKNMAATLALKALLKIKHERELAKLAEEGKTPSQLEEQHLDAENKSPISVVHEMAMKRGLSVAFEVISESGPPHLKVFTVRCNVGELETEGQGPTKQAAKKSSSENMVEKLKEIPLTCPAGGVGLSIKSMQRGLLRAKTTRKKSSTPVVKELEKQIVSPISRLIQIAHVKKYKEPEFALVGQTPTEDRTTNLKGMSERDRRNQRRKKPVFTMEVTVGPHVCRGTGPNKKAAKKSAADAAIEALGYGPIVEPNVAASKENGNPDKSKPGVAQGSKNSVDNSKAKASQPNNETKITSARQLIPGVLVLKSEVPAGQEANTTSTDVVAQEMVKVNSMKHEAGSSNSRDGVDKLYYLGRLLGVPVSYSDFPKKNEFLSVVSLGTTPPHVAHGCGPTLDEAQNSAAHKILEELSDVGLDSVTTKTDIKTE